MDQSFPMFLMDTNLKLQVDSTKMVSLWKTVFLPKVKKKFYSQKDALFSDLEKATTELVSE